MSAVLFASLIFGALLVCSIMAARESSAGTLPTDVVAVYGPNDVPPGLEDAKAVSAGEANSIDDPDPSFAIDGDGTVVAWGDNSQGQTDVPAELKDPQTSHAVDIDSNGFYTLALKDDGTVVV